MELVILAGDPGRVQIVLPGADLPAGVPWDLSWEVRGHTGVPRGGSGIGTGEQVVLVDVGAPIGAPVTYTLRVGGEPTATGEVLRPYSGGSLLSSLAGDSLADFAWLGDDPRQGVRRFHASDVEGSRRPPLRLAPVAGDGSGSLVAVTSGRGTATLRALLTSNTPLLLLHNLARCEIPGCDIPPSELVYITADPNLRYGTVHAAEREWSLSFLLAADPEPGYRAGTSTWDDVDAAGLTWDELDAMALTWDEAERLDWSQVGR